MQIKKKKNFFQTPTLILFKYINSKLNKLKSLISLKMEVAQTPISLSDSTSAKLNQPSLRKQSSSKSSEIIEESKSQNLIIDEAINERKKLSFMALEKWDESRKQFLQTHRNHVANVLIKLGKKAEFNSAGLERIIKFFKDVLQNEKDNVLFLRNKNGKLAHTYSEFFPPAKGKVIEEKKDYLPNFSKFLSDVDDLYDKKLKEGEEVINLIEKKFLKECLLKSLQNKNKKMASLLDRMSQTKKKISKANSELNIKKEKYVKMFNSMMEFPNKVSKKIKDLYNSQLVFLQSANDLITLHRELGKEVISFWNEILSMECIQLKEIQNIFYEFISKMNEKSELTLRILAFIQNIDYLKEAEDFFSIENTLDKDEYNFISQYNENKEKLSLDHIKKYFCDFEIISFEDKSLIYKEFSLEKEGGTLTKNWKNVQVIISIDNNLLIFNDEDKSQFSSANFMSKLGNLSIKGKGMNIEICEKVPGILFNSNRSYVLRSKNRDLLEELIEYINSKQ